MRIDGKRASQFTQDEIIRMVVSRKDLQDRPLDAGQILELVKTHRIRAERRNANGS